MKKSLILAAAMAGTLSSGMAMAEVTANAGAFSNYIFRGTTYSGDSAVVQGGIDWSADSGLYAGTWVSTLGTTGLGGNEIDFYAGLSGEAGKVGYDFGVLTYQYTSSAEFNYTEVYASGSFGMFTAGLNYTIDAASGNDGAAFDKGDIYLYGSADYGVGSMDGSFYVGRYEFDNDGNAGVGDISYNHYGASVRKYGFTFAVDKSDVDDAVINGFGDCIGGNCAVGGLANNMDAVRFTVSFTHDFEL